MDATELQRRKVLTIATAAMGGAGLAAGAIPFIESLGPSEAAKAAGAPATFDLRQLAPGALATVAWRGKPVWVLHRTDAMLASLRGHDALLVDPASQQDQQPAYARNAARAINPAYFVTIGICTHLGCVPAYRPQSAAADLGPDWPGGFYCPCHGSRFDLAGRVFRNVPAPRNLEVPPHRYLDPNRLLIGQDT